MNLARLRQLKKLDYYRPLNFFKWAKPGLFLFIFRSFHMTNTAQIL